MGAMAQARCPGRVLKSVSQSSLNIFDDPHAMMFERTKLIFTVRHPFITGSSSKDIIEIPLIFFSAFEKLRPDYNAGALAFP